MQYSAKDIAPLINGEIVGNPDATVSYFRDIESADDKSICFYADEKYAQYLEGIAASILITDKKFDKNLPDTTTLIKVENPRIALSTLLALYERKIEKKGIEPNSFISEKSNFGEGFYLASFAYVSENCSIGNNVKIFPHAFVGDNVKIGDGTIIHSGAKIYHGTEIGKNCVIHSGAVIGGDGFGFAPIEDGNYQKIPQIGKVILEDNVDIGCNTTVDRATMGATLIKCGTKLDNQIQIGHNVVIGKDTVIAAKTGIAGSTKVGDSVMIGGMTAIKGHINIGNNAKINAFSGVWQSVGEGKAVTGHPADDFKKTIKIYHFLKKLPELFRRVRAIEKSIGE